MMGSEQNRLFAMRDKMLRLGITTNYVAQRVGFPVFDVQKALRGDTRGRLVDLIGAALETIQNDVVSRRTQPTQPPVEEVFIRLPIYTADSFPH